MMIEKQVKRGDFMFECTFKNSDVFMPSNLVYDLILCHPVSLCEVSDGIVCLSTCAGSFVHQSASVDVTFHLHWEIWFWQNKPCTFCD